MPTTRHSLIARMRRGAHEDDWEKFYSIYEKPLLTFASSRSLSHAECQDVLQETMVKMLRIGFSRFDPGKGRFTGFLFHIAGCCVTDALRRRVRWQGRHAPAESAPPHGVQLPDSAENPAEAAERQGQIMLVHTVLGFLIQKKFFHPKTVTIFKAVTFEHLDPQEVASRFDTTVGNVYEAKRTVLAKVRAVLHALDQGADLEGAAGSR
jgi:RNA polymerase sigma factor (sigma-70 family)